MTREDAKVFMRKEWRECMKGSFAESAFEIAIEALEQPEHKNGKWIPVTRIYKVTEGQFPNTHIEWVDATEPDEIDAVRCSECREVFDFQDARNWCTECGADMREDAEEPKKCDNCLHEKEPWSMQCHQCEDFNLWEGKR